MSESLKRVFSMKFDSNPYEARQQITADTRARALRQLFASLTDNSLNALVSVKLESETAPEQK